MRPKVLELMQGCEMLLEKRLPALSSPRSRNRVEFGTLGIASEKKWPVFYSILSALSFPQGYHSDSAWTSATRGHPGHLKS